MKKIKSLLMAALVATSLMGSIPAMAASPVAPTRVNVHVGADASTEANLTWITKEASDATVRLARGNGKNYQEITGTCEEVIQYGAYDKPNKIFSEPVTIYSNQVEFKGLKPNTTYNYIIGEGEDAFEGSFHTAPKANSHKPTRFVYVCDPQIQEMGKLDSEPWGATAHMISNIKKVDFLYIAGDHTDRDGLNFQWEKFYNNIGAYPTAPQDMLAKIPVASVYGNHDTANNTLDKNINLPDEYGQGVYSYDYGSARYIMLNLETAKDPVERERQYQIAKGLIEEGKEMGLWIIMGWHKSLYTGASHVDDGDVIEGRKFWSPRLAALDVDMILQGHDHVYSRGFIDGTGYKVTPEMDGAGNYILPDNAPLWMVGNHAGGLKWYEQVEYQVTEGDPLAPNYEFLDVNSTDDLSNEKKEQTWTVIDVKKNTIEVTCYMMKYDVESDEITTAPYIYDQFSIRRSAQEGKNTVKTNNGKAYGKNK